MGQVQFQSTPRSLVRAKVLNHTEVFYSHNTLQALALNFSVTHGNMFLASLLSLVHGVHDSEGEVDSLFCAVGVPG